MKILKLKLLVLCGFCVLLSCTNHDLDSTLPKNVYVVGFSYLPGTQGSAALWKNDELKLLPFDNSVNSFATCVAVSGSDVYSGGTTNQNAVFWKDTALYVLRKPVNVYSQVSAMACSGSDIYLAGLEFNYASDSGSIVYWKNGVKTVLASQPHYSLPGGIAVSGSDVHVVGSLVDANWNVSAAYWKNGAQSILPGPGAQAYSIALSDNDVFVSGTVYTQNSYYYTACYWRNGVLTKLDTPDGWSSESAAIAVNGSDIYVVGTIYFDSPDKYAVVYWKNGVMTQLSDVYTDAQGSSIAVSGSDIYISGSTGGQAVYWKNGTPTILGSGAASAILVK